MAQVQLPNGQYVNIDSSGNILNNNGGIFTGGGASVPAVEPDVPLRNDQQNNPNGYGGTPDNPTNTDVGLSRVNASTPQPPSRNAGESAQDYATRLLNSPFFLAGGGDSKSAFVFDANSNSFVARPSSSVSRSVNTGLKQNLISTDTVGGSGSGSLGSGALIDGETDAQKQAREYLDSSLKTPESEADIIARKTAQASSRIQANKDYFASLLGETAKVNDLRTRETNARAVINGLSGSSEAGTMAETTANVNKAETTKVLAQQAVALENIYKDIQDSAHTEFEAQKDDAYKSATDILARKDAMRTKAVTDITTLSKSGFDFASIKLKDPVTYAHLAQSVGGEAQLNAISVLNRPQESIIDKKIENGKYVIAYQNPITGKTRIESTDLGIPAQYTKSVDLGDKIMFVPDNFNPAVDKPIYVQKGIAPKAPSNPTITEKKTDIVDQFTQAFTPGIKMKDGTPIIDENGFANPIPWKEAIKEAPAMGLSRAEFIKTFGHLLYAENGKISPEYGLTPVEQKLVLPIITATKTNSSSTREP